MVSRALPVRIELFTTRGLILIYIFHRNSIVCMDILIFMFFIAPYLQRTQLISFRGWKET